MARWSWVRISRPPWNRKRKVSFLIRQESEKYFWIPRKWNRHTTTQNGFRIHCDFTRWFESCRPSTPFVNKVLVRWAEGIFFLPLALRTKTLTPTHEIWRTLDPIWSDPRDLKPLDPTMTCTCTTERDRPWAWFYYLCMKIITTSITDTPYNINGRGGGFDNRLTITPTIL